PTTGQGIYFHNLGAGLIARNNTIYNTGDGIDGGPLPGEYLGDILIEDNILYNLTNGICFQSGTEDVIIKGNLVYNTEVPISVSGDNILIEENDIKEKTYRINTGKGKVKNALDKSYFVRSSWGAEITVGYTGGQVFDYEITYNDGDNSYTEPVWGPQGSEFTLKSTLEEECNGIIAKIITYPIKMMTVEGLATVKVNNIDFFVSQGESIIDFTVQATDGKNVIFIIEDLTPGKFYKVKKDNNFYTTEQANREGLIQFENSEWIREHRFEIEEIPTGRIDENKISLFPNPYVANRDMEGIIKFGNLPPEARIRIYTIKGEEIAIIENKSFVDGDSISWNVSNIASGVYIYYLDSAQRKEKGKVSIIK
ncbi:T9SS type A sorting domain-containing protein, partial [bacterium]|nr:T9SS type A sorting domain-containing protein [bacterium]